MKNFMYGLILLLFGGVNIYYGFQTRQSHVNELSQMLKEITSLNYGAISAPDIIILTGILAALIGFLFIFKALKKKKPVQTMYHPMAKNPY